MLRSGAYFALLVAAAVSLPEGWAQGAPSPPQASASAPPSVPSIDDVVAPPGLPIIGKWMIARDGTIAHWLGEALQGKRLREPINLIVVDAAAQSEKEAADRLVRAAAEAGYPIRFGHSTGYRGFIGDQLYPQLPAGRDDAFSNRVFELSNNHGRLFGPHKAGDVYVFTGAFSREEMRPFRWPEHGYASFNIARDDFAAKLDRSTPFKLSGRVDLQNAISDDPALTTGDHDGEAVVLRAEGIGK